MSGFPYIPHLCGTPSQDAKRAAYRITTRAIALCWTPRDDVQSSVTLDWSLCMKPLTKAPTQSMPGFPGCQDMSRTHCFELSPLVHRPQVEVEDFVKRAKSLTKEIEELWLTEWGDAQGEMIWRWLSKTCFFNQQN